MTLTELRQYLYKTVKQYFENATVVWSESKMTNPTLPYVTLKLKNISTPIFSINNIENNVPRGYYKAKRILEINLYTKGREIEKSGCMAGSENTAADDLTEFVMYLRSGFVNEQNVINNLTIMPMSPVQDLTALVNDIRFEYRAMAELEINFILVTKGYAGQISFIAPQNIVKNNGGSNPDEEQEPEFEISPSGGGSSELNNKEIGYFENVDIKEEFKNE